MNLTAVDPKQKPGPWLHLDPQPGGRVVEQMDLLGLPCAMPSHVPCHVMCINVLKNVAVLTLGLVKFKPSPHRNFSRKALMMNYDLENGATPKVGRTTAMRRVTRARL